MENYLKITALSIGIPLLIQMGWFLLTVVYPRHTLYNQSNYKEETGVEFRKALFDKGLWGEFLIFIELEKIEGYKRIVSNIYLDKGNDKTEVDLIMVNRYGIYVFESKNYSGKIYGNDKNKNWVQYVRGRKYKFYNPVSQNNIHINALLKTLDIADSELVHSYIVFGNKSDLRKISIARPHVTLLQTKDLLNDIAVKQENQSKNITVDEINQIYEKLRKYAFADEKTKEKHIANINRKYR